MAVAPTSAIATNVASSLAARIVTDGAPRAPHAHHDMALVCSGRAVADSAARFAALSASQALFDELFDEAAIG